MKIHEENDDSDKGLLSMMTMIIIMAAKIIIA